MNTDFDEIDSVKVDFKEFKTDVTNVYKNGCFVGALLLAIILGPLSIAFIIAVWNIGTGHFWDIFKSALIPSIPIALGLLIIVVIWKPFLVRILLPILIKIIKLVNDIIKGIIYIPMIVLFALMKVLLESIEKEKQRRNNENHIVN